MRIRHLSNSKRSKFYPPVREALRIGTAELSCSVHFGNAGGYAGSVVVRIGSPTEREFEAEVELRDPTRFPARIRAACTALRDMGRLGCFCITHQEGRLTIIAATGVRSDR